MGEYWGAVIAPSDLYDRDGQLKRYFAAPVPSGNTHTGAAGPGNPLDLAGVAARIRNMHPESMAALADQWSNAVTLLTNARHLLVQQSTVLQDEHWRSSAARDAFLKQGPGRTLTFLDAWIDGAQQNVTALRHLVSITDSARAEVDNLVRNYQAEAARIPALAIAQTAHLVYGNDLELQTAKTLKGGALQAELDHRYNHEAQQLAARYGQEIYPYIFRVSSGLGPQYKPPLSPLKLSDWRFVGTPQFTDPHPSRSHGFMSVSNEATAPGGSPQGLAPPSAVPPGSSAPGVVPPGVVVPGGKAPGTLPPGIRPPGTVPPSILPPGGAGRLPGAVPPPGQAFPPRGTLPPGGTVPGPGTLPPGGTVPGPGTLPPGGTVPGPGTVPSPGTPPGAVPGTISPPASTPIGTIPPGTTTLPPPLFRPRQPGQIGRFGADATQQPGSEAPPGRALRAPGVPVETGGAAIRPSLSGPGQIYVPPSTTAGPRLQPGVTGPVVGGPGLVRPGAGEVGTAGSRAAGVSPGPGGGQAPRQPATGVGGDGPLRVPEKGPDRTASPEVSPPRAAPPSPETARGAWSDLYRSEQGRNQAGPAIIGAPSRETGAVGPQGLRSPASGRAGSPAEPSRPGAVPAELGRRRTVGRAADPHEETFGVRTPGGGVISGRPAQDDEEEPGGRMFRRD
ncbi:hypothetical protein [Actinoplanes sp. NBRC 101535]|uniref:hypothetical protein n=1 Tax=Actinoplanes sp. NBRC 101535 TaxID=3032196 RepID=UPI0024A0592B|nr:hypothetical protein [Actinoplanes sp. NBRC 101535]GLY01728.1 hypothetical protein Acsp01_21070 [Actinoplanes sp. NBRC 101535]